MTPLALVTVALLYPSANQIHEPASEHARNPVLTEILDRGVRIGETIVRLPAPTLADGLSADRQREILWNLAGSDRALDQLLRDSVTAPFLLKLRDLPAVGSTIRAGDLYFVLHVDLGRLDPAGFSRTNEAGPVEAGNMRFEVRLLTTQELATPLSPGPDERLLHATGRLLDRIAVESTSRVIDSRSTDSLVVSAMTDRRFDNHERWPNRWSTLKQVEESERLGIAQPYVGGIGYLKATRLAAVPHSVFVELHFAFAEPQVWFSGAPILRSKLALIAQDQIRRLRRELAQRSTNQP